MGELVPVTDLAPAAIEAELRDLSGLMGDGNSVYWRDDSVQARYRDLLDARDGPASAGEGADVSDDLAPVSLAEFNAADPGVPYLDYIKSVASAADVVLTAPEGERDSLIAAFNRLPDRVAAAMIAELTNPTGTGFGFCSEPEVRSFAANGRGGRIIREWGNQAPVLMARVQARIYRCAAALDDSDYDAFMDWIEGLTDGQAAAVYRKLAA